MTTPELITTFEDFSLHRRESDLEEFGLKGTAVYSVDAPRWYVTFGLADDTLELSTGQDILDWHVTRATRQIVDAILDNPVVKAEVLRRYVAREKVRELLWIPEMGDKFDVQHIKADIRRLLEEDE